jgi:hypothetical protein
MFCISPYSRLLKSIATTMLVAGLAAAQAQTPAGQNRPATVPEGYVITPFGYFHPTCVNHLAKGDVVRQDEAAVQHANGTSDKIHACAYPHYKADGEEVIGDERGVTGDERTAKQPTISHAWVESASTATSSSYGEMYAAWTVPPAPSSNDGQIVYLFPGMEDYSDVVTIIQPVLGWNADYPGGWGIASWNCCVNGTVNEAAPAPVNSGDTIRGYMWQECGAGTFSCGSWAILTEDTTAGNYSELVNSSSQGQTFNWAFAGALEVYNISQCSDYPTNHSITFYEVGLFDYNFNNIANPSWTSAASSGLSPSCNYGVGVNLHY